MELKLGRSRTNLPVLYEQGGGMTNTGECHIVCGPKGERLVPMFSTQNGYSSFDHPDKPHAVFRASVGMIVIHADRLRDYTCYIFYRLDSVEGDGKFTEVARLEMNEWSGIEKHRYCVNEFEPPMYAAEEKIKPKHRCREAHYVAERDTADVDGTAMLAKIREVKDQFSWLLNEFSHGNLDFTRLSTEIRAMLDKEVKGSVAQLLEYADGDRKLVEEESGE